MTEALASLLLAAAPVHLVAVRGGDGAVQAALQAELPGATFHDVTRAAG